MQEKIVIFNTQKNAIFEYNRLKIVHKIPQFFEYLKTREKGGVDLNECLMKTNMSTI